MMCWVDGVCHPHPNLPPSRGKGQVGNANRLVEDGTRRR